MAQSIYRRLTGRARTFSGYSQLWIAPDHLLMLRSTRFTEFYQRFALADIQAVIVTELPARFPLQAALGAAALLWLLSFTLVASRFAKGFFIITGAIGLAMVILDVVRGPRCRCYLHTAVSRELLTPVARLRTARAFLAKLQPAIEAVQGVVTSEQIPGLEDQTSAHAPAGPGALTSQPPEIAQPPGYLPETVFGLFLINAALILLSVLVRRNAQQVAGVLLTTLPAELLLAIVALLRRGARDPRRYIYVLLTIALLGIGWDLALFGRNFWYWIDAIQEASQHGRPIPTSVELWTVFDRQHGLFAAGWRAAAGVIGLAAAYFERPRSDKTPAQPQAQTIAQKEQSQPR